MQERTEESEAKIKSEQREKEERGGKEGREEETLAVWSLSFFHPL